MNYGSDTSLRILSVIELHNVVIYQSKNYCTHLVGLVDRSRKKRSARRPVERWRLRTGLNIELNYPQNLERLVLCCIDSYDSESRRIFQHFSRSTRLAYLCTAQTSKFHKKSATILPNWQLKFQSKFQIFSWKMLFLIEISMRFCRDFANMFQNV